MSEPLSILLHAAARGARLQTKSGLGWNTVYFSPHKHTNVATWRIHPNDKHLRYGPISRVLFEAAKEPQNYLSDLITKDSTIEEWTAKDYAFSFKEAEDTFHVLTKEQSSFFLLLVAEALAHDGL